MHRSICLVQPSTAIAGKSGTWKFIFTSSVDLPKNSVIRFDTFSDGRSGDWEIPETLSDEKSIWLTIDEIDIEPKKVLEGKSSLFEFVLPKEISQGKEISITFGSKNDRGGIRSQTYTQRKRPFYLYIDKDGNGDFKDPEVFTIDVKGDTLSNIKVITPSIVVKNDRFDMMIHFEDTHGNLTNNSYEDVVVELSYKQLRKNLNWKLFMPETGFITLPNIYFNEVGTYRIHLTNLANKEIFISSPIRCVDKPSDQIFWGLFHGSMERFDGAEDVESSLRYFRDTDALHFFSISCSEDESITSNEHWKLSSTQVIEFNEEERFVATTGFQYLGDPMKEGLRHFVYSKDNKPILRKKDQKYSTLKKLYKLHQAKSIISIPALTMHKKTAFNFENFDVDFERVVEIYGPLGSSEYSGCEFPIDAPLVKEGSIRRALTMGCRFGFVAGGADKQGVYSDLSNDKQIYPSGLTAILSPTYSRDAILQSLYDRRCYATTGSRTILYFTIADNPMGSELNNQKKPGLFYNRHINIFAAGRGKIDRVILIRNGESYKSFGVDNEDFYQEVDDEDKLDEIAIKGPKHPNKFIYYYVKVIEKEGDISWASPIWVDII